MRVGGDGAMGVIGRHGPPNTHPTNPEPAPFENAELARSTRTVTETRTEKIKLNYTGKAVFRFSQISDFFTLTILKFHLKREFHMIL